MSSFSPLSAILGIVIGIFMAYWYFKRKSKGLAEKAQDFINDNPEKFTSVVKSEATGQAKKDLKKNPTQRRRTRKRKSGKTSPSKK